MAKAVSKPKPALQPDEALALTVATGYARHAVIALAQVEHPRPNRVRAEFDQLCRAEAMLDGALEIVRAHKDKTAGQL